MNIRPAQIDDSDGIAHVNVITWQSAYQGIISDTYLSSMSESKIRDVRAKWLRNMKSTDYAFVALNEIDKIVGFIVGGKITKKYDVKVKPRVKGEVGAIYISPEYQHQGIGRGLMHVASLRLSELNLCPYLLWTLEQNPARGFYEHLGGYFRTIKQVTIGKQILNEVCYTFDSIVEEKN